MIRIEQKIEKLERETFPVIIERISINELAKPEKKALNRVMEDLKKGKRKILQKILFTIPIISYFSKSQAHIFP